MESHEPRGELFWSFHGVKTTLGVETTLSRCRNYPLSKGTEMTPRGQNYSSEFTVQLLNTQKLENIGELKQWNKSVKEKFQSKKGECPFPHVIVVKCLDFSTILSTCMILKITICPLHWDWLIMLQTLKHT